MINFANGLAKRNHNVELLVGRNVGPFAESVAAGVAVFKLNKGMLRSIPTIRRQLRKSQPDLLLASQPHVNLAAIMSTRFMRQRPIVVLREASTPSMDYSFTKSWLNRIYLKVIKQFVTFLQHLERL